MDIRCVHRVALMVVVKKKVIMIRSKLFVTEEMVSWEDFEVNIEGSGYLALTVAHIAIGV